ncbi:hypothetical protein COTS27_01661 [Spirochaetota bacterium]|nr:hypothetical protein COTS27_01661 [Spirochaetota bacterium]
MNEENDEVGTTKGSSDVDEVRERDATSSDAIADDVANQSLVDTSGGTPSSAMLVAIIVGSLFIVFSAGLSYYFFFSYRDLLAKERLTKASVVELREQRAMETEQLSEYGVLDAEKGIIRLPIEAGIDKTLERYK